MAGIHLQNSDLWDEISLWRVEHEEIVDVVAGRSVVHLQCHLGLDTLSLARHGAQVTGLDFSQASIDTAKSLAEDLGIEAQFVCADVYDAPTCL